MHAPISNDLRLLWEVIYSFVQ